jgi:hypothetical protein
MSLNRSASEGTQTQPPLIKVVKLTDMPMSKAYEANWYSRVELLTRRAVEWQARKEIIFDSSD